MKTHTDVQRYHQSTAESCLSVALLQLMHLRKGIKITQKLEQQCLFSALRETRDDFVIGHLRFLSKRFGMQWKRTVQIPTYARWLKRFDDKKVETAAAPINNHTIAKQLTQGPVAILL